MPRVSQLKSADEVHAQHLRADPGLRAEYDRSALARAVAMRLVRFRAENHLTQTALAKRLGMAQPAIARLEAGDHEPSLGTLARLARGLGMEFHIDITPDVFELRDTA